MDGETPQAPPVQDPSESDLLRWRGTTWLDIFGRLARKDEICSLRAAEHERSSTIWRRIATPLAWLTAVLAAVSGLSIFTDRVELAAALSLITAVVAATNAALSPADTARAHRAASLAYERLRFRIEDVTSFDIKDDEALVPPDEAKEIRETLRDIDKELNAIAENSPPTRRVKLPP